MNRNHVKIVAFAVACLASAAALAQDAPPAGLAQTGKVTFDKACYTCHGTTGQGAVTGPRIGPTALPFSAFIHQVRQPASQMVPFPPTILSDQDVADIYAYLTFAEERGLQADPAVEPERVTL